MPITMEELKKFALDVHNFAFGTDWDDLDIVSAMDFDGILKKMKSDEDEQQETAWKCMEKLRILSNARKDEIKKLKEQLETANQYCEQWGYKWNEEEEVYVNEDDQ